MPSEYIVPIKEFAPVPIVKTRRKLAQAAARLAAGNSAFVIPQEVASEITPIVSRVRKARALLYALNELRFGWEFSDGIAELKGAEDDRGLHSNPFVPEDPIAGQECVRFHTTLSGSVAFTAAESRELYKPNKIVNNYLDLLLRSGLTDIRYADPDSFQQATITAGQSVAFRLNEGAGRPVLLHDFTTIGVSRGAHIGTLHRPAV